MTRVFIGLGSNLGKPIENIQKAIQHIEKEEAIEVKAVSSLYQSTPVGEVVQDDFINAVIACETSLQAVPLLQCLQAIEHTFGRVRTVRWGPRTLDLDILLFGQEEISSEKLTVPHPELHRRAFVLLPLAEIAPALIVPGFSQPVATLAQAVQGQAVEKLIL